MFIHVFITSGNARDEKFSFLIHKKPLVFCRAAGEKNEKKIQRFCYNAYRFVRGAYRGVGGCGFNAKSCARYVVVSAVKKLGNLQKIKKAG